MKIEQLSRVIVDALINLGEQNMVVSGITDNPGRINVETGDDVYNIIIIKVTRPEVNKRIFNPQPKPAKRK